MSVDLEELAAIIEQLDQTEFTDFLYENGDLKIRVQRGGMITDESAPNGTSAPSAAEQPSAPAATAAAQPAAPAPATAAAPKSGIDITDLPAGHKLVTAPMLGTFYASPKPGEGPFVSVGSAVEADAVVCIIEVMKLMNSVPAGSDGEIVEILAQDGDLVEHDQPLFVVKES